MERATHLAADSRDSRLTLRRVERQQYLIERLYRCAHRLTFRQLADELSVTERTIARDIARLRHSGVRVTVVPGRSGCAAVARRATLEPLELVLPEIAALLASLTG